MKIWLTGLSKSPRACGNQRHGDGRPDEYYAPASDVTIASRANATAEQQRNHASVALIAADEDETQIWLTDCYARPERGLRRGHCPHRVLAVTRIMPRADTDFTEAAHVAATTASMGMDGAAIECARPTDS